MSVISCQCSVLRIWWDLRALLKVLWFPESKLCRFQDLCSQCPYQYKSGFSVLRRNPLNIAGSGQKTFCESRSTPSGILLGRDRAERVIWSREPKSLRAWKCLYSSAHNSKERFQTSKSSNFIWLLPLCNAPFYRLITEYWWLTTVFFKNQNPW